MLAHQSHFDIIQKNTYYPSIEKNLKKMEAVQGRFYDFLTQKNTVKVNTAIDTEKVRYKDNKMSEGCDLLSCLADCRETPTALANTLTIALYRRPLVLFALLLHRRHEAVNSLCPVVICYPEIQE